MQSHRSGPVTRPFRYHYTPPPRILQALGVAMHATSVRAGRTRGYGMRWYIVAFVLGTADFLACWRGKLRVLECNRM